MRMLQLAARLLSCGNCEHDDRAKEAEERINFINTFSSPPATLHRKTISRAFSDVLCSIQRICAVVVLAYSAWFLYFGPSGHYLFECIQHCLTEMQKLVYKVQKSIGSLRQRGTKAPMIIYPTLCMRPASAVVYYCDVICIIRRLSCVCWGETQWEDSVGTARWCSVVLSRWWGYYYHHNPAQIWSATSQPSQPSTLS